MRGAEHVTRMEESRGVYRVLVGKPEGKRPQKNPGLEGQIILRWIFGKWDVEAWTRSKYLKKRTGGGTCE